jgi:ElaB/YqjD/DUF883 family membrane-anchored ribosome-binding protein
MTNESLSELKSRTDYSTGKVKNGGDDAPNEASQTVQQTYQDAKDAAQRNLDSFEQLIRDKPVQAMLVAAGIGFLLGVLIAR